MRHRIGEAHFAIFEGTLGVGVEPLGRASDCGGSKVSIEGDRAGWTGLRVVGALSVLRKDGIVVVEMMATVEVLRGGATSCGVEVGADLRGDGAEVGGACSVDIGDTPSGSLKSRALRSCE